MGSYILANLRQVKGCVTGIAADARRSTVIGLLTGQANHWSGQLRTYNKPVNETRPSQSCNLIFILCILRYARSFEKYDRMTRSCEFKRNARTKYTRAHAIMLQVLL